MSTLTHATPEFLGRLEPESDAWYALRATGIGASEIAAAAGLSPWLSPFSLWHIKAGTVDPGYADNPATYWGKIHEPAILAEYAKRHGPIDAQPGTFRSATLPWQLANPDALADDHLVEAKTSRTAEHWGEDGSDEIPLHYRCQVMQQMDVMGADRCVVAVLIGGADYREYPIAFDETDAAHLRQAGTELWSSIEAGIAPPLDAASSTTSTLRALHPAVIDTEVEIPAAVAAAYWTARADLASASEHADLIANVVRDLIGDGRYAVCEGRKVATRSVSTPNRLDAKALKADHPDLVAAYTHPGESVHRLIPAKETS